MDVVSCAALALVQGHLAERFGFLGPVGSPLRTMSLLFLLQYIALKVYRVFLYHRYFSPLRHLPGPTVSCSIARVAPPLPLPFPPVARWSVR